MDEPTGIYRGEVLAIIGGLLSIQQKLDAVLAAIQESMAMKKRKKTPASREDAGRTEELRRRVESLEAEFGVKYSPELLEKAHVKAVVEQARLRRSG
jgi:hypothetical protein